ncbi:Hypothetical predicted protein, partial [Paramuricea clavata]
LLLKATDLNLVNGECNVNAELEDLPFVVYRSSPYIRKKCLAALKKRKNLKKNLYKTNEQLTLLYRQKCEEYGFSMKRRDTGSVVPRKLRFLNNTDDIDKEARRGIQVQDDEIHQEILQDLHKNQYISSPIESKRKNQLLAHTFVSTPVSKGPVLNPDFTLSPINEKVNVPKSKLMPSECPVTVSIKWAERTKTKILPPVLSAIGKMLCRGTKKQIARAT